MMVESVQQGVYERFALEKLAQDLGSGLLSWSNSS